MAKELMDYSALMKCLEAKRERKSNSLETILYRAVDNITTHVKETIDNIDGKVGKTDHGLIIEESNRWKIDYRSLIWEVKRLTDASDVVGKDAFYCDLGEVTHRLVIGAYVAKFKAQRSDIGRGNDKRKALVFTKKDLLSKGKEYELPDKISPTSQIHPLFDVSRNECRHL